MHRPLLLFALATAAAPAQQAPMPGSIDSGSIDSAVAAKPAEADRPAPRIYDLLEARDLRSRAERAAATLDRGLEGEGLSLAQLRAAIDAALPRLDRHPRTAATLRAARTGDDAGDLYALVERSVDQLRFRPVAEAQRPVAFPQPAPIDEVVLKSYPRYRMAVATMDRRTGMNRPFMALFNHIKTNDIAMTAPVQVDYDGGAAEARETATMAFLYEEPEMGEPGPDDRGVEVVDVAPVMALSIGASGYDTPERTEELRQVLLAWLATHADFLEVCGPLRTMGHNSPMVRAGRRFFEVEIPVRWTERARGH